MATAVGAQRWRVVQACAALVYITTWETGLSLTDPHAMPLMLAIGVWKAALCAAAGRAPRAAFLLSVPLLLAPLAFHREDRNTRAFAFFSAYVMWVPRLHGLQQGGGTRNFAARLIHVCALHGWRGPRDTGGPRVAARSLASGACEAAALAGLFRVMGALSDGGAAAQAARCVCGFVAAPLFFLAVFHLDEVVFGLCGLSGDGSLREPWRAVSLAEFWSRRWNLPVQSVLSAYIFAPLRRACGAAAAVAGTFLASAALHFVPMADFAPNPRRAAAAHIVFFAAQAAWVCVERSVAPGRGAAAVFLLLSSPWFLAPLFSVAGAPLRFGGVLDDFFLT